MKRRRRNRSRRWVFTEWDTSETMRLKLLTIPCKYIQFQLEEAPSTKLRHLQGFIVFQHPKDFSVVKKFFGVKVHIERMRGNLAQNKDYCSKRKTKVVEEGTDAGPWSRGNLGVADQLTLFKVLDPMEGLKYKDWQQDIINIIDASPHNRKIYWYWDGNGGVGKSVFTKHLVLMHEALVCNGSAKDMMFFIATKLNKTKKNPKIIVFDIPRAKNKDYLSYVGIEKIKDGCFLSTKYESSMVVYNPPHILVFANWPPDEEKLSPDRWVIEDITETKYRATNMGPSDSIFDISDDENEEKETMKLQIENLKTYDYPTVNNKKK